MNKETILMVNDVYVKIPTFLGNVNVLNGVNLELKKNEITGLIGETGSGKSITAASILQLIKSPGKVTKGNIIYKNNIISDLSEKSMAKKIRGKEISYIPQGSRGGLNPTFSIGDQLSTVLRINSKITKKEALFKAEELLYQVGIPDPKKRLKAYPHELSGGMCQRVMIAIGLASNPSVLIADEPTTGLDVTIEAQILELIQQMINESKLTCLFITHDIGVIAEICTYTAVMYCGQIIEYGKTDDIFNNPKHPYTYKLLKSTLRVDQKKNIYSISGSLPNLHELPKGCYFHPRCEFKNELCEIMQPENKKFYHNHYAKCHRAGEFL